MAAVVEAPRIGLVKKVLGGLPLIGRHQPETPVNPHDAVAVRPDVAKASRIAGGTIFDKDIADYHAEKAAHLVDTAGMSQFEAMSMTKVTPDRTVKRTLFNDSHNKLRNLGLASAWPKNPNS